MTRWFIPGDIEAALDELGYEYRVQDGEAWMLCIYHDDTSIGSFSLNLTTGLNYCFACGEKGPFHNVVIHALGKKTSYDEANDWCQARARKTLTVDKVNVSVGGRTEYVPGLMEIDTSKQINEASLALFTMPPMDELDKRRISADACIELGILWDTENEAWILPIRDPWTNDLWGWQSKSRDEVRNRPRTVEKSRTLFGLESPGPDDRRPRILVESPLDCARFLTAGIRGAVSSYGVRFSDEQCDLLAARSSSVVLALDNDSKGIGATSEFIAFGPRLVPVRVFNYGSSRAKDPGEMDNAQLKWGLEHAVSSLIWRP